MSDKRVVLVDVDGVITDFEYWFLKRLVAKYPELPFIPVKERRKFYAQDDYPSDYASLIHAIFESKGFFLEMPPIAGALDAMRILAEKHDVFICTAPFLPSEHCVGEKFEWVRKFLGEEWLSRLIISKDKTMARGDYLIDDKPAIVGVKTPEWEHIIFDAPYNREVKDLRRVISWATIYDTLPELRGGD